MINPFNSSPHKSENTQKDLNMVYLGIMLAINKRMPVTGLFVHGTMLGASSGKWGGAFPS